MSIHTCSYYCDRFECIRAQRDELRQKLEQAVAAEREACAKLCEEDLRDAYIRQGKPARDESMLFAAIADCANAIRARGKNNG